MEIMFKIIRILSLLFMSCAFARADIIEISLLDLDGNENASMAVDLNHGLEQILGTNLFLRLYAQKCPFWLNNKPPQKIQESWDTVSKNLLSVLIKFNVKSIIIVLSEDVNDMVVPGRGAPWIVAPSPNLGFKPGPGNKPSLSLNNHKGLQAKYQAFQTIN